MFMFTIMAIMGPWVLHRKYYHSLQHYDVFPSPNMWLCCGRVRIFLSLSQRPLTPNLMAPVHINQGCSVQKQYSWHTGHRVGNIERARWNQSTGELYWPAWGDGEHFLLRVNSNGMIHCDNNECVGELKSITFLGNVYWLLVHGERPA